MAKTNIEIANQDSLVFDRGISREAYFIVNEQIYRFVLEPNNTEAGILFWTYVMNSLFFPEPEAD